MTTAKSNHESFTPTPIRNPPERSTCDVSDVSIEPTGALDRTIATGEQKVRQGSTRTQTTPRSDADDDRVGWVFGSNLDRFFFLCLGCEQCTRGTSEAWLQNSFQTTRLKEIAVVVAGGAPRGWHLARALEVGTL